MSLLTILLFIAAEPTAVTKPATATPTCVTAVAADGVTKSSSSTCTRVVTGCATSTDRVTSSSSSSSTSASTSSSWSSEGCAAPAGMAINEKGSAGTVTKKKTSPK